MIGRVTESRAEPMSRPQTDSAQCLLWNLLRSLAPLEFFLASVTRPTEKTELQSALRCCAGVYWRCREAQSKELRRCRQARRLRDGGVRPGELRREGQGCC